MLQYKKENVFGGIRIMLSYNQNTYETLLGNISEKAIMATASCMSQCTGCMCNCRCSCSGGIIADFEWEVI